VIVNTVLVGMGTTGGNKVVLLVVELGESGPVVGPGTGSAVDVVVLLLGKVEPGDPLLCAVEDTPGLKVIVIPSVVMTTGAVCIAGIETVSVPIKRLLGPIIIVYSS
jgi:hypothetical protein